jgi:small subunit ribosomal protein S13
MKFKSDKMEKVSKYFRSDFGIEKYCEKYLMKKRGYNTRHVTNFIKENIAVELENRILNDLIDKKERQKPIEMIENLKHIHSYRGMRHIKFLPTRGQRTKTNAQTNKKKSGLSKK